MFLTKRYLFSFECRLYGQCSSNSFGFSSGGNYLEWVPNITSAEQLSDVMYFDVLFWTAFNRTGVLVYGKIGKLDDDFIRFV